MQKIVPLFLLLIAFALPAHAADEPGSRDHPMLARFPGAEISYYRHARLDEAALIREPYNYTTHNQTGRGGPAWLKLEGTLTQIRYAIPAGHASLEVLRRHQAALAQQGFTDVFACANDACFSGGDKTPYIVGQAIDTTNRNPSLYETRARYLLLKREGPQGPTHVALLIGEFRDRTTAYIEIVEPEQAAQQVAEPPKTQPDACPKFAGAWVNVDPKTRSIAKATTTGACVGQGGKFVFKGWGACAGSFCEWDPLELSYDAAAKRLTGDQNLGYAREAFSITLGDDDQLRVGISTLFTDNSGRQPMTTVDVLRRGAP